MVEKFDSRVHTPHNRMAKLNTLFAPSIIWLVRYCFKLLFLASLGSKPFFTPLIRSIFVLPPPSSFKHLLRFYLDSLPATLILQFLIVFVTQIPLPRHLINWFLALMFMYILVLVLIIVDITAQILSLKKSSYLVMLYLINLIFLISIFIIFIIHLTMFHLTLMTPSLPCPPFHLHLQLLMLLLILPLLIDLLLLFHLSRLTFSRLMSLLILFTLWLPDLSQFL